MLIKDLESMWYEYGEAHGRVKAFIELVKDNTLEISRAAEACDMTEEEFAALMERTDISE